MSFFSPVSGFGAMPCAARAGPMIAPSGQALAPASHFQPQDSGKELRMNATFGLHGSNSLSSATLQSSLESRLRARTASVGSILYRLTWKARVTPSGRAICALRGSNKRTFVNVFILSGWGTPVSNPANGTPEKFLQRKQESMDRGSQSMGLSVSDIQMQAQGIDRLPGAVPMVGWNTPTCPVNTAGHQAGNNRYVTSVTEQTKNLTVAIRGKLQADGSMLIGSCVETLTENQVGAPLRPGHSRWLMGLPVEWENCAPSVTRSTWKQRQISAKSSEKSSMIYDL